MTNHSPNGNEVNKLTLQFIVFNCLALQGIAVKQEAIDYVLIPPRRCSNCLCFRAASDCGALAQSDAQPYSHSHAPRYLHSRSSAAGLVGKRHPVADGNRHRQLHPEPYGAITHSDALTICLRRRPAGEYKICPYRTSEFTIIGVTFSKIAGV
jgi:hypothetical protein